MRRGVGRGEQAKGGEEQGETNRPREGRGGAGRDEQAKGGEGRGGKEWEWPYSEVINYGYSECADSPRLPDCVLGYEATDSPCMLYWQQQHTLNTAYFAVNFSVY